jgi:hypothetical protein
MDVGVVQHLVRQQVACVQSFLVEPVETDASARAGHVAQHAAVPDERFQVDDSVDAATAGMPQKTQRVARERQRGMRVDVMMFSDGMISSISTLDRICVKQRKCSVASG